MAEFTDKHRDLIDFERTWWKYAGAKEAEIRERFAMSSTRYYQALNWAIDQAEALKYDPMTVRRLRRLREQRAAQRSARRCGLEYAT